MWLKLCLLLIYILLIFILSRILDAISWCESGYNWALSRQLLDPMVLSVTRLKALLEQRGVNYEGVVEKSELTSLVEASGQVSAEEAEMSKEGNTSSETNFTSGAHFIEQVEDAKDSVWLVQVVSNTGKFRVMSGTRWKAIKEKASKFGIRTGFLDCSLDARYCSQKGWRSPFLLLALPSQFEKKASVALYNYSGSVKETAVFHWVRDKLDEKVQRIDDPGVFHREWQDFSSSSLDPEIRAVLFTKSTSAPLFYSALSVKFPGRVKFGLVSLKSADAHSTFWKSILGRDKIGSFPFYVTYIVEKNYTYGLRPGELYNFSSMEQFLKFLYPCLNDIFIASFCVANVLSWFEFFISNCSILRRFRKFIWCMFKYNIAVIMLWLPVIGIFQMPYLDRIPLLALKAARMFCTSQLGTVLRGDYSFYVNHPLNVFVSFSAYLALITFLCKKYRLVDENEDNWFSFSQMRPHAYLRPNDFFEPMRLRGYDLLGGLDVFGSHLSQPSLWLRPSISMDYIKHLPTWRYCSVPLSTRAADNSRKVEMALKTAAVSSSARVGEAEPCTSAQEYLDGGQSANMLGPHPSLERDSDRAVLCSMDRAAVLSDERMQPVYCCSQCQMCSISRKASDSTAGHMSMASSNPAHCTAASNSVAVIPNHSPDNCQCNSHQKKHDLPSTICPIPRKPHSCRRETHDRSSCSSATNSSTVSLFPESTHTCQAHSEAAHTCKTHSEAAHTCKTHSEAAHTCKTHSEAPHTCQARSEAPPTCETHSGATPPASHINTEPVSSTSSTGSGFPAGYLESHQCVICLDEYAPLTMLCGLPCGHVFHESCIISWFNREKHFCPMCRWPSYKLQHPHLVQRLPPT